MSLGGDDSTSMQGGISKNLQTLLGSITGGAGGLDLPSVSPIQGKKPKAKSPVATFLGASASPSSSAGATMLASS